MGAEEAKTVGQTLATSGLVLREDLVEDLFDARREFDRVFNRMLNVRPWGK